MDTVVHNERHSCDMIQIAASNISPEYHFSYLLVLYWQSNQLETNRNLDRYNLVKCFKARESNKIT